MASDHHDRTKWEQGFTLVWEGRHTHTVECGSHSHHGVDPWSIKALENAIRAHATGTAVGNAAQTYGVPRTTLRNYVDSKRGMYGRAPGEFAYDTILSPQEEEDFLGIW
jgi:hypothetical protein